MPGIYGHIKQNENQSHIQAMTDILVEGRPYTYDPVFENADIAASRAHIAVMGMKTSPYSVNGVHIWIEGEGYNVTEVAQKTGITAKSLEGLLLKAHQENKLEKVLGEMDGYFAAALYDEKNKKLHLITDRLGMRPLYIYSKDENFAWAGEVKQLLALPFTDKTIDKTTAPCFMELGYLLEDHTWFEHIKLTHPASIYTFDLKARSLAQNYYWSWSKIKQQDVSFDQAVDALCDLLPKTVEKRLNPNEKIGIALSGGLDSRLVFAAANELYPDYRGYAYTFGRVESGDVKVAQQVASLGHWEHEVFDLNNEDWFEKRKPMIWRTEGMLSMLQFHGAEFAPLLAQKIDINLSGYAGDVVTGGSYISENNADQRIDSAFAKKFYKGQMHLTNLENVFYDIPHVEPHIYMNRVRRFTNVGTINTLSYLTHRKPFMDNDLMEFMFSISDLHKKGNKVYATALLKRYPAYFKDIIWQKTGKTVDKPAGNKLIKRILGRAERTLSQFGVIKYKSEYTDYDRWIREESVAAQLRNLLAPENSEYAKVLPGTDYKKTLLEPHLNNRLVSKPDAILRVAAMEIYLRKLRKSFLI